MAPAVATNGVGAENHLASNTDFSPSQTEMKSIRGVADAHCILCAYKVRQVLFEVGQILLQ